MENKKTATAMLLSMAVMLSVVSGADVCVDLDQKAFNLTDSNITETTRDRLSALGYYCDITLSWNVTNSTVFDKSKHEAASAMYQKIYAQTTEASIDGERKEGITKDCLAYAYKVVCAYHIPKCTNGKDVV